MIYIVTPGKIYEKFYNGDSLFSDKNYTFFNVSNTHITDIDINKYKIINHSDITYSYLGKGYAEGEVVYNIYKNKMYVDYDYIGFLHQDFDFDNREITRNINNLLISEPEFISFFTYTFFRDYNQHIMMDEKYPEDLVGLGDNCYVKILEQYNSFYKKLIFLQDLFGKRINLCSAFLVKKNIFEHMMKFISNIIESGYLDKFDTLNRHRFQGHMFERYIAMYSSQINFKELEIKHGINIRHNY